LVQLGGERFLCSRSDREAKLDQRHVARLFQLSQGLHKSILLLHTTRLFCEFGLRCACDFSKGEMGSAACPKMNAADALIADLLARDKATNVGS